MDNEIFLLGVGLDWLPHDLVSTFRINKKTDRREMTTIDQRPRKAVIVSLIHESNGLHSPVIN